MSPFEILYGCKCNTPISWSSPVDRLMLGPNLLKDMELTVKQVQQNLKASRERHKSYVDLKITPREFQVDDHVYINVNPNNFSLVMEDYSKLAPRYCETFEILYGCKWNSTISWRNHVDILIS